MKKERLDFRPYIHPALGGCYAVHYTRSDGVTRKYGYVAELYGPWFSEAHQQTHSYIAIPAYAMRTTDTDLSGVKREDIIYAGFLPAARKLLEKTRDHGYHMQRAKRFSRTRKE